ncbi:alcohol dehydrogenase catalytic domain-containing protein [Planosporangium thailandense]|uniref:Alcohol dehydrogenase catalytic domain-containing protein n=1 Tax=Planosporangium thailandense TaxID=765197 RepID=A0ABX0Y2A3_9ACTN|nr:alcohol dehydrogenase catalytic domain-containing protein [Planosporangium thailandense]NJC72486.1 alcohol dehydrogenase catalytic domain-containing protein [Planosporangium thailandense]
MRALTLTEPLTGTPPQLTEAPDPVPGYGEALVRIHAAALNHRDLLWMDRERGPRFFVPSGPFVMGADGAGTVAAVGDGVTGWRAGDRVLIDPLLTCGSCEHCRTGKVIFCPALSVLGGPADGTLAELIAVPARNLHRVPAHLNLEQAAALPMALGTAYHSLFVAAGLQPGETVLVHGVGGGVAQIGAQLAVAAGATVIATSSDDAKLARARALGVAHTVNYRRDDVEQTVRDIVGPHGVDVVLDGVGGPALLTSLKLAAPRGYGRVVRFGSVADTPVDLPAGLHGGANLLVGHMAAPGEMAAAVRFVAAHRVTPVVAEPMTLHRVDHALTALREGRHNGKLIVNVEGAAA